MRPAGPIWTPYEDERLRALASMDTHAAKIAEQLNRTEGAVRKRAARLNIVLSSRVRRYVGEKSVFRRPVCTKNLSSGVVVMKSAQDGK
jgi:hypothetical protein